MQSPMSKFYRGLSPGDTSDLVTKITENPYGPIEFKGRTLRMVGTYKKEERNENSSVHRRWSLKRIWNKHV